MRKQLYASNLLIIVCLICWGCTKGNKYQEDQILNSSQTRVEVETSASKTSGPKPTEYTAQSSPTSTTELTDIITPIQITKSPTASPTWTPLPTLSSAERVELVLDLLTNNAGCELPCWWGIIPGKTTWRSAKYFFASFASKIGQGVSSVSLRNGVTYTHSNYGVYFEVLGYEENVISGYRTTKDTIDLIVIKEIGTELRFSLDQVLTRYGQPEDVKILAEPDTNWGKPLYYFYLFYPKIGIIAIYNGEPENLGDKLRACPQKIAPELYLFPSQEVSLSEMAMTTHSTPLLSIEDWPNLNLEYFYKTLQKPGSCIDIEILKKKN